MVSQIEQYIALFFIYSFAGWLMESLGSIVKIKKFVDRGFLIGPYCPIYGCGVLLITILLQNYREDIIITFIMSLLICGILEYATSFIMEKIFKARWWDYTNRRFNINGRICLETLIPFGIAGVFIIYIANPFFLKYLEMVPDLVMHIVLGILMVVFLVDLIVSFKIILNLKEMKKEFKDSTEEISEKVKKILRKQARPYRRLVHAFPKIEDNVRFSSWDDIKKKIEDSTRELKTKIDNSKDELKAKIDNSKLEIGEMFDTSKKSIEKVQRTNKIMLKKVRKNFKRKKTKKES